ncbi:MAG: hypothetical protein V1738_02945 [Patescibacteria group bacterium]
MSATSKNSISLAGEFLVLSHLSLRGYIATLTLGHTKGVDILLSNPETGKLFKLEVKTTTGSPHKSKHYGLNIGWHMSEKHESITDKNLFYCFVQLENAKPDNPRFFIVPSVTVAKKVKEDDDFYYALEHKNPVRHTEMRWFFIGLDDEARGLPMAEYENNWSYFDK